MARSLFLLLFLFSINAWSQTNQCISALSHLLQDQTQVTQLEVFFKDGNGKIKPEVYFQFQKLIDEAKQKYAKEGTLFDENKYIQALIQELQHNLQNNGPNRPPSMRGSRVNDAIDILAIKRTVLLAEKVNRSELNALYRYSKDHTINSLLREHKGNLPDYLQSSVRPEVKPGPFTYFYSEYIIGRETHLKLMPETGVTNGHFVYHLDKAIEYLKSIKENKKQILYRGSLWPDEWVQGLIQSKSHADFGYTSLSRSADNAKAFIANPKTVQHMGPNEKGIMFIYHTNKSIDVSFVSNFVNEAEEITARGERFVAKHLGNKNDFCSGIISVPAIENVVIFYLSDTDEKISHEVLEKTRHDICR